MLGDDDARSGIGERPQPRRERSGRLRIELRHRLVEQQQRWSRRERRRERDPLQLTARELTGRPVSEVRGAGLGQRLEHALGNLRRRPGGALEREGDLAIDREHDRPGLGILEDDAGARAHLGGSCMTRIEPRDLAAPGETTTVEVRHEAAQHAQQRRLARAARSGQQHELACVELEVDAGERVPLAARGAVADSAQLGEHRSTTPSAKTSMTRQSAATASAPGSVALPSTG